MNFRLNAGFHESLDSRDTAPPPLPPGPPPSTVRRTETTQALPDRPGAGDGNPFSEPPLAGGGLPGMPGAA